MGVALWAGDPCTSMMKMGKQAYVGLVWQTITAH